jgi:hypothetical protein
MIDDILYALWVVAYTISDLLATFVGFPEPPPKRKKPKSKLPDGKDPADLISTAPSGRAMVRSAATSFATVDPAETTNGASQ